MNKIFAVITADVIDSKKSQQVSGIEKLVSKSYELNYELIKQHIAIRTGVSASRGDELQIICSDIKDVPRVIRYLRYFYFPVKLRIGVGIGTIDNIDLYVPSEYIEPKKTSWNFNGNAFFHARKAIDLLKQNKEVSTKVSVDTSTLEIPIINESLELLIQSIDINYILINTIIGKWSKKQWEYVYYYDKYNKYDIVASKLGVTPQAVAKSCTSAGWKQIQCAERIIEDMLIHINKMLSI